MYTCGGECGGCGGGKGGTGGEGGGSRGGYLGAGGGETLSGGNGAATAACVTTTKASTGSGMETVAPVSASICDTTRPNAMDSYTAARICWSDGSSNVSSTCSGAQNQSADIDESLGRLVSRR